jgi:hypothetical protein
MTIGKGPQDAAAQQAFLPNPEQTIPPENLEVALEDAFLYIARLTGSRDQFDTWLKSMDPSQIMLAVQGKRVKGGDELDSRSAHIANTVDFYGKTTTGVRTVGMIEAIRSAILNGDALGF